MPSHSQVITAKGLNADAIKSISYTALEKVECKILFATDNALVAHTKQTSFRFANELTIEVADEELTVTSKMIHGEIADLPGRTKKDVTNFISAFEAERISYNPTDAISIAEKLDALEQRTVQQAEEEIKQAVEVDKAMNLSTGSTMLTYAIIIINIVVFVLMALDGAGILDANGLVHIRWGSNFNLLTQSGDWWRLITNVFIHFGIIHLVMNMYALYMVGVYLEPMLGKPRFLSAYFATGIIASLVSLWWHKEGVNSAGASGAIFGMYGLFLALLTTKLIPDIVRKSLLQTTAIFVGYNLLYGMKGGIDNAAHIGGLVSGFIIGQFYILSLKKEKEDHPPMKWAAPLVLIASIAAAYFYLEQNKIPASDRKTFLQQVVNEKYEDYERFNEKLDKFDKMHARALSVYNYPELNDEALRDTIENISIKYLNAAEMDLIDAGNMNISASSKQKIEKLKGYIRIRKEEMNILLQMINAGNTEALEKQLEDVRTKANNLFEEALAL